MFVKVLLYPLFICSLLIGRSFSLNASSAAPNYLLFCLQHSHTCQPNIQKLIKHFVGPSDVMVDIGSSSGYHAVVFQASRNATDSGFITIIDSDAGSFNSAIDNAKSSNVYDRLVAFLIPRDKNDLYSAALDNLFLAPHVSQCPSLLHITDIDATFLITMNMTMRCRPTIMAERLWYDNTPEFVLAMEEMGYSLFWHTSFNVPNVTLNASRLYHAVTIYIVAVPVENAHLVHALVSEGELIALQRDNYVIDEYNISLVTWKNTSLDNAHVIVNMCICRENKCNTCDSEPPASDLSRSLTHITHSGTAPAKSYATPRYNTVLHISDITHSMDDPLLQHCVSLSCYLAVDIPAAMSRNVAHFVFYAQCNVWVAQFNKDLIGACVMMLGGRFDYWKRDVQFHSTAADGADTAEAYEYFDAKVAAPFSADFSSDVCSDPIWCSHTKEFQERLFAWQYPVHPSRNAHYSFPVCDKAKYLVYQPYSHVHGIGSMMLQVAIMFRLALCLGRILYLLPVDQPETSSRWLHPGCRNSVLECYFERITNCTLPYDEYISEVMDAEDGNMMHMHPFRDKRILYTRHLPTKGPCSVCGQPWSQNTKFFDGLFTGESGYVISTKADGTLDDSMLRYFDQSKKSISHMDTFMQPTKHPWVSQFVRYMLNPRPWFAEYLQHTVSNRLTIRGKVATRMPKPFASLHVRFGEKQLETALQPIEKYMRMLRKKGGNIRNVFVSTETESVIEYLTSNHSDYNFYYLNYTRHEYIHNTAQKLDLPQYPIEYMMSMANLYVAVEADAFIGSLTSGWCMVIHAMERTRGDGGYDYFSVDRGSAYSTCF